MNNIKSFLKWHKEQKQKLNWYECPGENGIENWYNDVENCHKNIRGLLGGVRKIFEINIPKTPDDKVFTIEDMGKDDFEDYQDAINCLRDSIPNTMDDFEDQDLLSKHAPNGMKWGKFIISRGTREIQNRKNGLISHQKYSIKTIETLMSTIGDIKANLCGDEKKIFANVTTTPESFVLLGYYGPDSRSCFKHQADKYILGTNQDSFVCNISTQKSYEGFCKASTIGRFWGLYNKDNNILAYTNFYIKGINKYHAKKICESLTKQLLKCELAVENFDSYFCTDDEVYINGDSLFFSDKKKQPISIYIEDTSYNW